MLPPGRRGSLGSFVVFHFPVKIIIIIMTALDGKTKALSTLLHFGCKVWNFSLQFFTAGISILTDFNSAARRVILFGTDEKKRCSRGVFPKWKFVAERKLVPFFFFLLLLLMIVLTLCSFFFGNSTLALLDRTGLLLLFSCTEVCTPSGGKVSS